MNTECLLKWLDVILDPIVIILVAITGYIIGHKIWRKQKLTELKFLEKQQKYRDSLKAYKAVWALIIYFSENDNARNILERGETDSEGNKIMYFKRKNAEYFFKQVTKIFYTKGYGIFLSSEIKSNLFKLRGHFIGLYHNAQKEDSDQMKIKNKELLKDIVKIREDLIKSLRELVTNTENIVD
ncbi:CRISPR-associated protein Csx28 [Saccharicrinis sp. FJH54]|uniref:type VI-B CRISPR accessory protein Csx28 n=1 Tax=Saccharicrinis sp. FJH54 TaxID=3344665 RepID=UPI0035D4FF8D